MNLELDKERKEFQDKCKKFSEDKILPLASEIDNKEILTDQALSELKSSEILPKFLPPNLGGNGYGLLELSLFVEELGKASPALALFAAQQIILGIRTPLEFQTTTEAVENANGAANLTKVFSAAITEEDAGSDIDQTSTVIRKKADGTFEITGKKSFVNWANRAHRLIIFGKNDNETGFTTVIIKTPNPGLQIAPPIKTMGLVGIETSAISFAINNIPNSDILGVYGFGKEVYTKIMNDMRIAFAAIAVGIAQKAFDDSVEVARNRKRFGKPIGSFQALQWKFSDCATKIDAARLHVWKAVEVAGNKLLNAKQAAMAKVFCTETAFFVADFAVQVHGGKGYIKGNSPERLFRDARFLRIGQGTSEILRNLVAAQL